MPESELFGQLLVRLGVVRAADVARALELQRQDGRRLGEVLVDLGLVGRAELETALLVALGLAGPERAAGPPRLGEVLVGLKYLDRAALDDAVAAAGAARRPLGEHLIDRQLCSHAQVYEALALQARGPAAPEPPAIRGARIVVVDDSPVIRELLVESLVALGHAAHAVGDPFDALAQIVESPPALVVTDLDMPGLDGLELCRRLKAGPARKVPVILLTASDGDVERVRGLRAGADDYVSKSASLDELGARIASLLRRTSETERVRQLFARYTSPAVVEEILRRPELVLTGEQRECTILFADLRDFTALAEALPAVEVVELLNEVLGRMAEAVLACDGTLDKMLGDGIMAVFGAPVGRDNDALRAVHAAEMMVAAVAGRPVGSRQHRLAIGVGVNTGTVVAGNLGSAIRTDYTVIGDAVNVASRLCSLARAGEILIGERTQDLLAGAVPCEALAPVRLKGKAQPVPVARVARALARAAQR